jgi:hypothetical protein
LEWNLQESLVSISCSSNITACCSSGNIYEFDFNGQLIQTIATFPELLCAHSGVFGYKGYVRQYENGQIQTEFFIDSSPITSTYKRNGLILSSCWNGKLFCTDSYIGRSTLLHSSNSAILVIAAVGSIVMLGHYDGTVTILEFKANG